MSSPNKISKTRTPNYYSKYLDSSKEEQRHIAVIERLQHFLYPYCTVGRHTEAFPVFWVYPSLTFQEALVKREFISLKFNKMKVAWECGDITSTVYIDYLLDLEIPRST